MIPPEELLREEVDCLRDQGDRRLLVLEAIGRAMPVYTSWPEAVAAPAEAFAALEAAGRDAVAKSSKREKALSAALKAAQKAAGYDRKKGIDLHPRARLAAHVCSALDGALGRYVGDETVTLGFVRDALAEDPAELALELARAKAFNASDDGWQKAFAKLVADLVPPEGEASTPLGEIVRCLGNLADEAMRNGNVNFGDRHRLMIAKVRETLPDPKIFNELECRVIESELMSLERDAKLVIRASHRVLARYAVRYSRHA